MIKKSCQHLKIENQNEIDKQQYELQTDVSSLTKQKYAIGNDYLLFPTLLVFAPKTSNTYDILTKDRSSLIF